MDLSWDHYRSFLAVVRRGSLSAAARDLDLTQPTLGRHIAALEEAAGAKLFTRSQTGLRPTPAALELVRHAEAMAASAEALQRTASGEAEDARGAVRVTASEIVGVEILPPILAAFREKHPQIAIELSLSNLSQDLLRREADIAVRMVKPKQKALVARKIGDVELALFAHRKYIARRGMPENLEQLLTHTIVGFDADDSPVRGIKGAGLPLTRDIFAFRSDNDHAQLAMLRAGFGIAGAHALIAARDRDLVRLPFDAFSMSLPVWLVMHEDLRDTRRVRLLYEHLAEGLRAHLAGGRQNPPPGTKKGR
ncbi:MAG TPA: LysR family transcriptional regulator [Rhizomicrobium sp.]|jgi:DNA-binding transcriptional LysR family regulator